MQPSETNNHEEARDGVRHFALAGADHRDAMSGAAQAAWGMAEAGFNPFGGAYDFVSGAIRHFNSDASANRNEQIGTMEIYDSGNAPEVWNAARQAEGRAYRSGVNPETGESTVWSPFGHPRHHDHDVSNQIKSGVEAQAMSEAENNGHTVTKGESLWSIARDDKR